MGTAYFGEGAVLGDTIMPVLRNGRRLRFRRLQTFILIRLSTAIAFGLSIAVTDILLLAFQSDARLADSPFAAQARGRKGSGGGYGGGRGGFDSSPSRDSFRSNDDRSPQFQPPQQQQQRNSDRDDRKRDDDDDDNGDKDNNNAGNSRLRRDAKTIAKPSLAAPRTVAEVIDRMLKPPLGSVPSDLFDIRIGGLATNEVLAVNPGPSLLESARQMGFGVQHKTTLGLLNLSIVRLTAPPGMGADQARSLLERGTRNGHFAFNHVYRPYRPATGDRVEALPPDQSEGEVTDTCAGRCYAHRVIQWQAKLQSCALKTRIGFIDAAVDLQHPSLSGRNIHVGDFRRSPQPSKASQHGTSTLAVLAGGPGGTVAGLLPNSEYFAADIFFPDEQGEPVADTIALLQALEWMSAWDVRLVNLSLAGPHDPLMQQAIAKMARKGIVFIAAAGNDGPDGPPLYPAAYHDVIAVSAVAKDLRSYHRGNRGSYIDVAAPGVAIWTAVPGGEGFLSGTSFAVPFVTAIIATVTSQVAARDKRSLLASLRYKDLGPPGRDPIFGRGLVLAPLRCSPARNAPAPAIASHTAPVRTGWSASATPTGSDAMRPALRATGAITSPSR